MTFTVYFLHIIHYNMTQGLFIAACSLEYYYYYYYYYYITFSSSKPLFLIRLILSFRLIYFRTIFLDYSCGFFSIYKITRWGMKRKIVELVSEPTHTSSISEQPMQPTSDINLAGLSSPWVCQCYCQSRPKFLSSEKTVTASVVKPVLDLLITDLLPPLYGDTELTCILKQNYRGLRDETQLQGQHCQWGTDRCTHRGED